MQFHDKATKNNMLVLQSRDLHCNVTNWRGKARSVSVIYRICSFWMCKFYNLNVKLLFKCAVFDVNDLMFNAESQCCQCLFTYTHISSNVPNVVEVCVCGFVFLQTEVPTHGGLAEVTKSTSTGVVRHQESRNAPVESNAIAQTPNSTVTVMLITNSGEWIHCLTHLIVVHLFFVRHPPN